jgi:hypothetical protein
MSAALAAAQAAVQAEANHPDASGAEHELLEQTLRERARVIRELEVEVARRDRLVRDLAGALEEAQDVSPAVSSPGVTGDHAAAAMAARLDAMALDLARRESAAQAAAWENEELQRRLAIAERAAGATPASPGGDDPSRPTRLTAALDELDALRLALRQEHDARVRAESRGGPAAGSPLGAGPEPSAVPTEQR